jgi:acylaminoacyl-peptidase
VTRHGWIGILGALAWIVTANAADSVEERGNDEGPTVAIETVLALGPLPLSPASFAGGDKEALMERALVRRFGRGELPRPGQTRTLFGRDVEWRATPVADAAGDSMTLWTFHLEAARFVSGHLQVENLDGASLYHADGPVELDEGRAELALPAGSHTLWLLHHGAPSDASAALTWQGYAAHDSVSAHIEPRRRVSAQQLTNAETVDDMALSPDGRYLALSLSRRSEAADLDLRRMIVHDLRERRIVDEWTASVPGALAWGPDNRRLAIHQDDSLWLRDLDSGRSDLLLAGLEGIGTWRWHPDGQSIVFAWTSESDAKTEKRRRVRSLEDRWAGFRDNRQIYQVDATSGLIRPLTARDRSLTLHDIHSSGDRLLLSERIIDYTEPPHGLHRLFELTLPDLEEREIGRYRRFNDVRFAESGYWLLAGPGLAVGDGDVSGAEQLPNDYDTQLYALAASGDRARSLSRDYDPAFGSMHRLASGDLLLSAIAGERVVLVRFDRDKGRFVELDTGVEVVEQFVASDEPRPTIVLRGTDADAPQRVHRFVPGSSPSVLRDSAETEYADVVLGEVRPWNFTNASGTEIEGRYYLPPDFDPEKRYPLIVYYYGGTAPVNRQFTGRYPFNLWAAKGYVIYVLQPRGTIGYGQAFSARHVNAWGRYTADDIIEGTDRFVAAHDFVDGDRVGNIGASYGGFMTMYLATRTDRFAASISHAGISALTSYWGEGWWGYAYSGIASRGSFPWNNPELYVDQSPIYQADRITTPLLLLTGDSDTNVPPGESHTMYTALKLLGREVELIEFPGEDHWILDREKRYVWWDSILAWFDYWLKDEPQWWHHLYPETA